MDESLHFRDFSAYEPARQRDPEFNAYRLAVRRKLGSLAKTVQKRLRKEMGLELAIRTSLNHPYRFNAGRVNAQWAYLSRSPKDKRELRARVGPALGQDVDTHYIQTTLVVSLDEDGFEAGLRIHPLAWWDGKNLENKVREEMGAYLDLLNALPAGFILFMDSWLKEYPCGRLGLPDLRAYFRSYEPGEHWLDLRRRIPKEEAVDLGREVRDFVD